MYYLKINEDLCCQCGNCELVLPGLLAEARNGRLLISPTNMEANADKIQQAMESCHLDAMTLEEQRYEHV